MQLRQMDRVGLGGNISLVNQSVSLVFMVLVQVILLIPILLVTILPLRWSSSLSGSSSIVR